MRLIDADELQMEPDENGMMNGVKFNMASRLKNRRYAIGLLKTMIDNAPTVEAEPVRHGKWVDATGVLDSVRQYKCSECGKKPILNEHWCSELTKFCPFCGAKMG